MSKLMTTETLSSTEFVPDEHDIGIRFYLTAYGQESQAQTTFKDAINTTTTIASNLNPSLFGQSVTFTATVTCNSCTFSASQTVEFRDNSNSNCTSGTLLSSGNALTISNNTTPSASAIATYTTSALSVGTHPICANFVGGGGGNPNPQNSNSTALNQVVNKATPTLSVTNSPVTYNGAPQAATVAASVAGVLSNVRYNGSLTVPTNAGTYAVTANFVPTDTANYNSLTAPPRGILSSRRRLQRRR